MADICDYIDMIDLPFEIVAHIIEYTYPESVDHVMIKYVCSRWRQWMITQYPYTHMRIHVKVPYQHALCSIIHYLPPLQHYTHTNIDGWKRH